VRIALTIVDTPGFGDNINNDFAYDSAFRTSWIPLMHQHQVPGNCWLPRTPI
jgi:septin family protein